MSRIPVVATYGPRISRLTNGSSIVQVAFPGSMVAPTKFFPAASIRLTSS